MIFTAIIKFQNNFIILNVINSHLLLYSFQNLSML
jgi:hypothetical protein